MEEIKKNSIDQEAKLKMLAALKEKLKESEVARREKFEKAGYDFKDGSVPVIVDSAKVDMPITGREIKVLQSILAFMNNVLKEHMSTIEKEILSISSGEGKEISAETSYILTLINLIMRSEELMINTKQIELKQFDEVFMGAKDF